MRYAIDLHVHESCMRVAVRVLHSCAFIYSLRKKAAPLAVWNGRHYRKLRLWTFGNGRRYRKFQFQSLSLLHHEQGIPPFISLRAPRAKNSTTPAPNDTHSVIGLQQ